MATLLTACLLLQSATAVAPSPAWWTTQEVLHTSLSTFPDDFAAANVGQLKHMAAKAAAAMNAELPGGAGTAINSLVASWEAPPSPNVVRDDFQSLNLGQLKHVASLFYQKLGIPPPWQGGEALQDDYLWANVGQLKNAFSFSLDFRRSVSSAAEIPPAILADALADWQSLPEPAVGSTADDFDGDGISNLQEYQMGTPLLDLLDIDGDRIPDLVEDLYPGILDKRVFADAVADYDADGVMNYEEILLGLDLANASTAGRADGLSDAWVLAWGLLVPGTPLEPATDAVAAIWQHIDAAWVDAYFGSYAWLDGADANNDGEPDGLTAFRAESWFIDAGYIEYPPAPVDLDGDFIPDMDRDSDNMPDLWEYRYSFNPRNWQDWDGDPDADTLPNIGEFNNHANPRLADTDGDGFDDAAEAAHGSDPSQPSSQPPVHFIIEDGYAQEVAPGSQSSPLVVRVLQLGLPVQGLQITFTLETGPGQLRAGEAAASTGTELMVATDSNGVATATYIPGAGAAAGISSISAALPPGVQAINGSTVAFSLNVVMPSLSGTGQGDGTGGGNEGSWLGFPRPWADPARGTGAMSNEDGLVLEVSAKGYSSNYHDGSTVSPSSDSTTEGSVYAGSWNLTALRYYGFPRTVWSQTVQGNNDFREAVYNQFVSAGFGASTLFMGPPQPLPKLKREDSVMADSYHVILRTPGIRTRNDETANAIKVEFKGTEPGSTAALRGASRTYLIVHRRWGLTLDPSNYYQYSATSQVMGIGFVTFNAGSGTIPIVVKEGTLASGIVRKMGNAIEIVPQRPGVETADRISLLPVDIEPDANMAGVVGDVVKSAKAGSTIKHFVTPKKSDDLNQDYVELKATGVDAAKFDEILVWEGGEAGSATNKRKVKRDATGKTEVKIKTKQGNTVVAQMDVWVVWARQVIYWDRQDYQRLGATTVAGEGVTFIGSAQEFVFEIEPKTIATEEEIPDLKGAAESDPPGTGATHLNDGHAIGRPKHKWDISRQYRCKITTQNFDKTWAVAPNETKGGGIYATVVNTGTVTPVADFPQNPLEGNDDTETETTTRDPLGGENSNPYDDLPNGVSKGQLYDSDLPSHPVALDLPPPVGASLQVKLQFKQFCRLEIGKKWFLISSPSLWRHHAKLIKARASDPNGDLYNGEVGEPRTGNGDW